MGLTDEHGQLTWNEKAGQAYYRVAWPLDLTPDANTFSGNIKGGFSDAEYTKPIQVQACFVPGKSSTKIVAADGQMELTIPEGANGGDTGLYAAITIGYHVPKTDLLPSGHKIQGNQIYYVTVLQPPSKGAAKGKELKEMPEGAEIKLKVLSEGCDLCRLVEYKDDEDEVGSKWKSVKDPSRIRYLGTFALVSNGSK